MCSDPRASFSRTDKRGDDNEDTAPVVRCHEVIIIGAGLAGLSAAIYLGRSRRDTLLIHTNRSMAKWEVDVQNYLGFPEGIDGTDLLARGILQVVRFDVSIIEDDIYSLSRDGDRFCLRGGRYRLPRPTCARRHRTDAYSSGDSRRAGMLGTQPLLL